jgi:hypothetical protein
MIRSVALELATAHPRRVALWPVVLVGVCLAGGWTVFGVVISGDSLPLRKS